MIKRRAIPLKREYRLYLALISAEIAWSKEHRGESAESEDFEKGFIKGLEQALRIITKAKKQNESA
jgi:hypothetical protein